MLLCRHVGDVATAYHAVGLRVKSILDSADYGDEDEPMASEGHSSCPPSSLTCGTGAEVGPQSLMQLPVCTFAQPAATKIE